MTTKFAERIKELRKSKGITQDQVAKLLSVDRRSICNWERGVRQPDFDMLIKIAKVFDESADYLIGLTD